jgi:prepilin-type N-terminal cleavage/methylation domain-containing protein
MIRSTKSIPRERAGFTLIEVLIAMTISAIVLGSAVTAAQRGVDAYRRSATNSALDAKVARALDRIKRELVGAGRDTLIPVPAAPFGSQVLEFQTEASWAGAAVAWGSSVQINWEPAPGELDNGIDDNGNGLVDEGVVVRIVDPGGPGEERVVLVRGVSELHEGELSNGIDDDGNGLIDEQGLSFDLNGDTLNVRLSLESRGPNGTLLVRTLETSITLRN